MSCGEDSSQILVIKISEFTNIILNFVFIFDFWFVKALSTKEISNLADDNVLV